MSSHVEAAPAASSHGVQWLLSPCDPRDFFVRHWETQPLFIDRREPGYYGDLFSSRRLEEVLCYGKPKPPDIRVVSEQRELLPSRYVTAEGDLNLHQLYKVFDEGHTIVVNGLQRFCAPVAALCRRIQDLLNHQIIANVYLSPGGSRGLHPHFDTHDVFVLQIEGTKTWYLHGSPQGLPLLATFQPVIPRESLGEPEQVVTLKAGDMLYVPRGVVHHAEAQSEPSLHITLGVYPTQWVDLLTHALTAVSLRDERFRRALPPAFMDRDVRGHLQQTFAELAEAFKDAARLDDALAMVVDRFLNKSIDVADDHFGDVTGARQLALDTPVRQRPHARCRFVDAGSMLGLQFAGGSMNGTPPYRDAMRFIAGMDDPFTAADLPGDLDELRRIELVRRLIRAGLLQIHARPGTAS